MEKVNLIGEKEGSASPTAVWPKDSLPQPPMQLSVKFSIARCCYWKIHSRVHWSYL